MADQQQRARGGWGMAKVVAASSTGTAFEWYDFFIFGSLAATISKVFFAGLDPTAGLIAALGLFAAGFAFRPFGAILFGAMGDRIGRKATFLITVTLMGAATFAIGLLPTYANAGIAAPVLLIFLRICQGTALGGEYGGAAIYVAEHAPDDRRGGTTGWIQSSAAFGLLAALIVIYVTRTSIGEEAFAAWGWRVPFLLSILLLGASLWLRSKLHESPLFTRLRDEGAIAKAPLTEAFARGENLKRVLLVFFAVMCAQGAVWYCTFFFMQVFLMKSLGVPEPTVNLIVLFMTLASIPLYVFFGWLSDRVGRKPVMVGGMALALLAYFPGFHGIADAVNPALSAAQRATPIVVATQPSTCSVQFDPVGTAQYKSACDVAKSLLGGSGLRYSSMTSGDGSTSIRVGTSLLAVPDGSNLDAKGLKALKTATGDQLKAMLKANGYPAAADPHAFDLSLLAFWLLVFTAAACAVYGPQAAALVEMFPTRIRYTALSLPYHVGTGWVGGFLPVTSFALVAITGNPFSGLWYAVVFTAISFVTSLLFLPETRGRPLDSI
ncbi:MFS transporter [Sphingomonas ginkgonis]|uniref:MFS transporter n=1 Tax=Sphingomonas ginkgonis TaxID=2315330 RepID=A0A429VCL9_9SPHN|nr:MFS transporter [Sphingomonas ginkgonis]RST31637.1 MFS transporter [Sphingomonas ginkgonis]